MLLSPIEAPAQAPSERVDAASFILSLRARGIRDTAVLSAMERVRRDLFAPRRFADLARTDVSLPLPFGQTMTAPSTVATMLVALGAEPGHRVLEIGTGSGYVTALLARIGCRVTTIERYATLAEEAQVRLELAGVDPGLEMGVGNGLALNLGDERFDRILINGAVASMPSGLTSLLAVGGRLVGGLAVEGFPRLVKVERGEEGGLATVQGGALRLARLTDGRGALQAAA